MVTPTKSKVYHKAGPGRQQQVKTPLKSGGSRNRATPSPPTSVDLSFKTPQKPFHSMPGRAEYLQVSQISKKVFRNTLFLEMNMDLFPTSLTYFNNIFVEANALLEK